MDIIRRKNFVYKLGMKKTFIFPSSLVYNNNIVNAHNIHRPIDVGR